MTSELKILRHSAAELMALAVCSLFPKTQLVSGDITSLGFYYDFYFPVPITKEQIPFIEERMRDFMRRNLPIKSSEMMRKNAIELFKYHHQNLKGALLKDHVETLVHICQIGDFYDLGYPPFVETTGEIGVIKLLDLSTFTISLPKHPNLVLTRIQGVAFKDHASLKNFLKATEMAKKRDHRVLGKEMKLFTFLEENCPGCWSWYPKGAVIREILMDNWRKEHKQQDYQIVSTSNLSKAQIKEDSSLPLLRFEPNGSSYPISSTKAPFHALLFKSHLHSYRELPIRYCEYDEIFNLSRESSLWGLLNARVYTGDSSYVFCTLEQVLKELISSLQFIDKTFKILGFEVHWHLLAKSLKSKALLKKWNESQKYLIEALHTVGFDYTLDEEKEASYGPTVEVRFTDVLGRDWTGPYVYIDLYHPEQFGLHYQGQDDRMHEPIMMGRSLWGSMERLIALLIEHHEGNLPFWLAPEQVRVISIADKNAKYAAQVRKEIEQAGLRVGIDDRKENLGAKVHAAELEKVPYMIVIGDKEEKNKTISLRQYLKEEVRDGILLKKWIEELEIKKPA